MYQFSPILDNFSPFLLFCAGTCSFILMQMRFAMAAWVLPLHLAFHGLWMRRTFPHHGMVLTPPALAGMGALALAFSLALDAWQRRRFIDRTAAAAATAVDAVAPARARQQVQGGHGLLQLQRQPSSFTRRRRPTQGHE